MRSREWWLDGIDAARVCKGWLVCTAVCVGRWVGGGGYMCRPSAHGSISVPGGRGK